LGVRCASVMIVLTCLCGAGGCAGYVPALPRTAAATHVRAKLVRLRYGLTLTLTVRFTEAAPETRLSEAVLARAAVDPCRFGWAAREATLSAPGQPDVPHDSRALSSGDELTLVFDDRLTERALAGSRLDLLVSDGGREECIALPLVGVAPELAWRRDEGWMADAALNGGFNREPVRGVIRDSNVRFAAGYAWGQVRAFAGIGAGTGDCSARVCPPTTQDEGTANERSVERGLPLALLFAGADVMPWQTGVFAFGYSIHTDLTYVRTRTYEGARPGLITSIAVAPRLAWTYGDPLAPGLSGGTRNGFLALDVPVGIAQPGWFHGAATARIGSRLVVAVPLQ
jgi:hypothetical protein